MSLSLVYSRAMADLHSPLVCVETYLSKGLPGFSIVGLPEAAVRESRDRVRTALKHAGFNFPQEKVIVNLAPADLPKEGGRFDLAIAIGILVAAGEIHAEHLHQYEIVGELSLFGDLRAVKGMLPMALATKKVGRALIAPTSGIDEVRLVQDFKAYGAMTLQQVCEHLSGLMPLSPIAPFDFHEQQPDYLDLSDVHGQQHARRALEVAAAGGHSLLLIGPPGTGKTMLASRLPSILTPMSDEHAIETAAIASVSHQGFQPHAYRKRPFRAPHHSASSAALVGGGNPPRPGEISLAHNGVLFLDELPEFNRHVLETLREPMESGVVTISRAARQSEFPANFQLITAMNPCPCGFYGDESGRCHCTKEQIHRYRSKISGPILDRIDMHVTVPRVPFAQLMQQRDTPIETSETVRQRVFQAQTIQHARAKKLNAKLTPQAIKKFCKLSHENEKMLHDLIEKFQLSARSYHRILRVTRTIADLAGRVEISDEHLLESIQFRRG